MTPRLLLVDDDTRLASMVSDYLGRAGFEVETAGSLAAGRELLAAFVEQSREARRRLRLGDGEEADLDGGTLARLRSLGYVR